MTLRRFQFIRSDLQTFQLSYFFMKLKTAPRLRRPRCTVLTHNISVWSVPRNY